MSNIAGKSYAMNVITPVPKGWVTFRNRLLFWIVQNIQWNFIQKNFLGLRTLSLIHYARWVIIRTKDFPRLTHDQPKEKQDYNYMLFFSNFNGSWAQYVDSFSMAIPDGLDLLWNKNVKYPNSIPLQPFHKYITENQIWTNHYYNAYPLAASNDVKSADRVLAAVQQLSNDGTDDDPQAFKKRFNQTMMDIEHDLGQMAPTPIVSLSAATVRKRLLEEQG
ncbi:MAG: hypothetical protein GKR96_08320 [Gammaproteobacteria bacterium]|nr:hypothetical protein [Gammaproteobacteria bacterium]